MYTLEDVYELLKSNPIDKEFEFSHPIKTNNKKINLSLGRIWFNLITPDDYPLVNEPINKKKIQEIIKDIYNKYSAEVAAKFVTDINRESFKIGTLVAPTFDINSLVVPQFIIDKKKELMKNYENISPEEFNKIRNELAVEYLNYIRDIYDSGIYDILMSGAKGDPSDWALLMIAKGSMVDIEGNVSKPTVNSLNDGLTLEEFYLSSGEARYTQYQKSKGSADPGYLARKVAFANSNIILDHKDCKTDNYLKIKILPSMKNLIFGRYYLNKNKLELITSENIEKLVDQTILLRSPLYCKSRIGICKICYGTLAERLETDKIGLLSSATINDQGINTAMKTRHKTSQINTRKANFKKDLIYFGD